MPRCIYCLKDKGGTDYKRREHVLPQAFGKFKPNNLILNKIVCDECNQFFGDNIEIFLARDTIEGMYRLQHNIRPGGGVKKSNRLQFKIAEGEMKGVIVKHVFSKKAGESDFEPVLQICFYDSEKKEYECFKPENLPTLGDLKKNNPDMAKRSISYFAKPEEERAVLDALEKKGFKFKKDGEIPLPEKTRGLLTEGTVRIDPIIFRGFSKIAFNYLAYCEGRDFVLNKQFNPIREFIRDGKGDYNNFFYPNDKPILFEEQKLKKRTCEGHLIVAEWQGSSLVGRVSLFNLTTYRIIFCQYFTGIWHEIAYGHYFDMKSREVSRLTTIKKSLLP